MKKILQACGLLICGVACFPQSQTQRLHHPHFSPSSGQFGQPRSVETGDEEDPPNRGFLQCVINQLTPISRHGNNLEVSKRLGSSVSGVDAVIAGHGAPGIICTGDGDHCNGELDKMISSFNAPQWTAIAAGLKGRFRTITLLGCDVGAHTSGVSLMTDFANQTGATVIAPDAIVFCGDDGITLAEGGSWIRSDRPPPAQSSTQLPNEHPRNQVFRFRISSEFTNVPISSVRIVSLDHRDYRQREFQQLHLLDDHALLSTIDLQNPLVVKGRPGAIVTGHIVLGWSLRDRQVSRKFVLYNDELLEDTENTDVFYKTSANFREQIVALTR